MQLNETHDPSRRSWLKSANRDDSEFSLQNLPFGVFSSPNRQQRGGVAIGDWVLDLAALLASGLLPSTAAEVAHAACGPELSPLLALGRDGASVLRRTLFELLAHGGEHARQAEQRRAELFVPLINTRGMEAPA